MTDNAPNPDCLFCDGEGVDADPYDRFDYPCYEACSGCWPVQKVGTTYGEAAAYDSGVRAGIAEERARIVAWLRGDTGETAKDLRRLHANKRLSAQMTREWEQLIEIKAGIAKAIEAGEHLAQETQP